MIIKLYFLIIFQHTLATDRGLQLSLLDQMKLVYEANACSIENLIISTCNSSKTFAVGSPSSTSSSCNSDVDETQTNVSLIHNISFQIVGQLKSKHIMRNRKF